MVPGFFFVVLTGPACIPPREDDSTPSLAFDPPSLLQGTTATIHLSAEGIQFREEDGLTAQSLSFAPVEGDHSGEVIVFTLDLSNPEPSDVLSAQITVSETAPPGPYRATLFYTDEVLLHGDFRIREKIPVPTLTIVPREKHAGAVQAKFNIRDINSTTHFDPGTSHVEFGDGTHVLITNQAVVGDHEISLTVNISPTAPVGPMNVAVVTEKEVAWGEIEITDRKNPAIKADPDHATRPESGMSPQTYTISLTAEELNLDLLNQDAGPDGEVPIEFPENKGLSVSSIDVTDESRLEFEISVTDLALLGPTPLRVTVEDLSAQTDFTVLTHEGVPVLLLDPPTVQRGSTQALIVAKALNFDFGDITRVECTGDGDTSSTANGCMVTEYWVVPSSTVPKTMYLYLDVAHDYPAGEAVIEVQSGEVQTKGVLVITEPQGLRIKPPVPDKVVQGDDAPAAGLRLEVEEGTGTLQPNAEVTTLARSGVTITGWTVYPAENRIQVKLEVAADAPVGPSLLRVSSGTDVAETFLTIVPSRIIPFVELKPNVVTQGRRTAIFDLESESMVLQPDSGVTVRFDDPGVHPVGIEQAVDALPRLTTELSAGVRSDMTVAYFNDGQHQAAATFRVLKTSRPMAVADQPVITRSDTQPYHDRIVTVSGVVFGDLIAQVADNIGVEVEATNTQNPRDQQYRLRLNVAGAGPGGWIGVLLSSGPQRVVLPLYIDSGGDESLTMTFSPSELRPGSQAAVVEATLPNQLTLEHSLSEASTGVAGAFVKLISIDELDRGSATLEMDLTYGLTAPNDEVPVFLSAVKGAGVGMVNIAAVPVDQASVTSPWSGTLSVDSETLVAVDPGEAPTLIVSPVAKPDYAEPIIELLATNGFDTQQRTEQGVLWKLTTDIGLFRVSTLTDPAGLSSYFWLRPLGSTIDQLAEPDDDALLNLITTDPCHTPYLGWGEIKAVDDRDQVAVTGADCQLCAHIVARQIADRPWSTPDLRMEMLNASGGQLAASSGWPTPNDDDPRLYVAPFEQQQTFRFTSQHGTAGSYLINLRRAHLIREVCWTPGAAFVELGSNVNASLDSLILERVNTTTGEVEDSFSFFELTPPEHDGMTVVGDPGVENVDFTDDLVAIPPDQSFAFVLREADRGTIIDAVQVGGDVSLDTLDNFGIGDPLPLLPAACFFRVAEIDTNVNQMDFVVSWLGTPGE